MKKHSASPRNLFDYGEIVIILYSLLSPVNLERSLIGCLQLYERWYEFSFPPRTYRISSHAAKIPKIKNIG